MREPPVRPLPPGTHIGSAELGEPLGAGDFGITYRGHDHHHGMDVAVKEYLPRAFAVRADDGVSVLPRGKREGEVLAFGLSRFLAEAEVLERVDNPHVVGLLGLTEANGTAYWVLAYVPGETLEERLARGVLAPDALGHLAERLLWGLDALHRAGGLHADLRPRHVLLGDGDSPVLIDPGVARLALAARALRSLDALVAGYAAVEQYRPGRPQTPATDLYALGALLYRCMAGQAPPEAIERAAAHEAGRPDPMPPAAAMGEGYAPRLLEVVDWLLTPEPADRPADAGEVLERLAAAERGAPRSAPLPPVLTGPLPPTGRAGPLPEVQDPFILPQESSAPRHAPAPFFGDGDGAAAAFGRTGQPRGPVVSRLPEGQGEELPPLREVPIDDRQLLAEAVFGAQAPRVSAHPEAEPARELPRRPGGPPAAAPMPSAPMPSMGPGPEGMAAPPPGAAPRRRIPGPFALLASLVLVGLVAGGDWLLEHGWTLGDRLLGPRDVQPMATPAPAPGPKPALEPQQQAQPSPPGAPREPASLAAAGGAGEDTGAASRTGTADRPVAEEARARPMEAGAAPPEEMGASVDGAEQPSDAEPGLMVAEAQARPGSSPPEGVPGEGQAPSSAPKPLMASRTQGEQGAPERQAVAASEQGAADGAAGREEVDGAIAERLAAARGHLSALRLTTPAGRNALEEYRAVLARAPGHPEARRGLERIVETYLGLLRRALARGRTGLARVYLERAEEVLPEAPALDVMRAELAGES